jgi:hypothetical protein
MEVVMEVVIDVDMHVACLCKVACLCCPKEVELAI